MSMKLKVFVVYMTIPQLREFDRSLAMVSVNRTNKAEIGLYYGDSTKHQPLHLRTGSWTCPFGRADGGALVAVIPEDQYQKVKELDDFGRDVCRHCMSEAASADGDGELPYKSLMYQDDGLDTLHLTMSDNTRVFDDAGVKLAPDVANLWLSGQFVANFLLSLSIRLYSGVYYWTVSVVQIRVRRYCTLPDGCIIFTDEQELKSELESRKIKPQIKLRAQDEEAVAEFDPDVNELLD